MYVCVGGGVRFKRFLGEDFKCLGQPNVCFGDRFSLMRYQGSKRPLMSQLFSNETNEVQHHTALAFPPAILAGESDTRIQKTWG